jgi:hypothetical protein
MRYRLFVFPSLLLSLLVACSKDNAGPQLDLVGSSRYTSYDRTIATPGDTVTFKLYSSVRSADRPLSHVRILVTYAPVKNPLTYPANYDPTKAPADPEFVYLDSAMSNREFVLQATVASRTTSGREQWRFEAEDSDGNKVGRGFRLQLRNIDSAATYHRYTAQLQAPDRTGGRRSFLALLPGLTLPHYTVRTNGEAQSLIDVVYVAARNGSIYLASPTDTITHIKGWPTRATEFRDPNLNKDSFDNADTGPELIALFNGAASPSSRTLPLAKDKVYAFRTKDQNSGLIYVQSIVNTPIPTVVLQVRITK